MAGQSATDRMLFDAFNACPWNTEELRIDHVREILRAKGFTKADAETLASDAYGRWIKATKIMGAN